MAPWASMWPDAVLPSMQLLFWAPAAGGANLGTLQCQGGHVHIVGVPASQMPDWEALVNEIANGFGRLPPTVDQMVAGLGDRGVKRARHGVHIAFDGDLSHRKVHTLSVDERETAAPKRRRKGRPEPAPAALQECAEEASDAEPDGE